MDTKTIFILLFLLFVTVITLSVLIATNVIDTRSNIEFGSTPSDSKVLADNEYTSTEITVVRSNNTAKLANNVSITLSSDSPDWLDLTDDNSITGTVPAFNTDDDSKNTYSVTIEANYEKGAKKKTVIMQTFVLTVVLTVVDPPSELVFESVLPDVEIEFGAEFKSGEIRVLDQNDQPVSGVTLGLIEPNDIKLELNDGFIQGTAPDFDGDFTNLSLDPLFVQVSATYGVTTITQSFSITVVFPELKEIEWGLYRI